MGWNFNLVPADPDHPYDMPDIGDWVRFDGTLRHEFKRDPKKYMYTFVEGVNLKVIRAGTFEPFSRKKWEETQAEKKNEARRRLLPSSP